MGIIKKIVHYLACITYIFIIIYALICAPIVLKYKPVVVLSGSMEPTIKTGSIIYYKWIEPELLKKNDIITFNNQGKNYVSHRIVSIDDSSVTTKGDANDVPDGKKVNFENIRGKVANTTIPFVGYFVRIVNKHTIVMITLAVIIMVSEFLFSNIRPRVKLESLQQEEIEILPEKEENEIEVLDIEEVEELEL